MLISVSCSTRSSKIKLGQQIKFISIMINMERVNQWMHVSWFLRLQVYAFRRSTCWTGTPDWSIVPSKIHEWRHWWPPAPTVVGSEYCANYWQLNNNSLIAVNCYRHYFCMKYYLIKLLQDKSLNQILWAVSYSCIESSKLCLYLRFF